MANYRRNTSALISIGTVLLVGISAPKAKADFKINLIPAAGMNPLALTGFQKAAGLWSSLFTDNMTVNINVDFAALGSGIIGQTSSVDSVQLYSDVRNALVTDATSVDDALAVAHLQTGGALTFETNDKT